MRDIELLARGWESRLPGLDDPWTHWQIEADGFVFGLFSCQEIGKLMSALKENHLRFSLIFARRAYVGAENQVTVDTYRYEVVNRSYDTSVHD